MAQIKVGHPAPLFEGIDQQGHVVKLASYLGKKVVLFFYPADDTPGCTAEACNLRDNYTDFIKKGFIILGVSPDNEKSHKKFSEKFALPFPLIADTSKKILNDYGVWGEKNRFGKTIIGVFRTTFMIDEKGKIENIISDVNTKEHTTQILDLYKQ